MLCIRGTSHGPAVCPSVRPYVCVCVLLVKLRVSFENFDKIAPGFGFREW